MVAPVIARRFLKALSWRITSAIITMGVVYYMTESTKVIFALAGVEIIKFVIFMLHDQIWSDIKLGKN